MTASTPQNPPGGNPQRIFVDADTIVDRPPTLFRVPAVKKPFAPGNAAAASQEPPQAVEFAPPVSPMDSAMGGLGAAQSPAPGVAFPVPIENPVAPPLGTASGSAAGRADIPVPKSLERDKSAKTRPPVAGFPVPAGRSWMEGMGSRLVLLLLIGAIATVAVLANRGSTPADSNATLADLDLPSLDETPTGKSSATRNGSQNPNESRNAAERQGSNDSDDASESRDSNEFLSHDASAAERNSERKTTSEFDPKSSDRPFPNSPTESAAGETSTESNSDGAPRAAVPAFDLSGLQAANPQANSDSGAMRTEAGLAGQTQAEPVSVATRQFISEADRLSRETTPVASDSSPGSLSPEAAIRAAVDAAVAGIGQPIANSEANFAARPAADPAYTTTDQPAGVDDWSRYLPAAEPQIPFDANPPASDPYSTPYNNPYNAAPAGDRSSPYPANGGGGTLPAINPPLNPSQSGERGFAAGLEGPEARTAQNPYSANSSPKNPYANNPYAGSPDAGSPSPGNPYSANLSPNNPYANNPYAGNPYAGNPYAGNPSAGNPTAGNSFSAGPQANPAPNYAAPGFALPTDPATQPYQGSEYSSGTEYPATP